MAQEKVLGMMYLAMLRGETAVMKRLGVAEVKEQALLGSTVEEEMARAMGMLGWWAGSLAGRQMMALAVQGRQKTGEAVH